MSEKVSVIVPIYKVEKYLNRCVESIVNQTYTNLEIILVNDGSPDASPALCEEWASKDARIIVIHKENGGVSSARNAGLDRCSGEYITFADPDDYLHLEMIETLVRKKQPEADIVICNMYKVTNGIEEIFSEVNNETLSIHTFFANYWAYNKLLHISSPWNSLYSMKIIMAHNLCYESKYTIGEDTVFNLSYFMHCESIQFISETLYYYDFNTSSATNTFNVSRFEQIMNINILRKHNIISHIDVISNLENQLMYKEFILIILSEIHQLIAYKTNYTRKEKITRIKECATHPLIQESVKGYKHKKITSVQDLKIKMLQLLTKMKCYTGIYAFFYLGHNGAIFLRKIRGKK